MERERAAVEVCHLPVVLCWFVSFVAIKSVGQRWVAAVEVLEDVHLFVPTENLERIVANLSPPPGDA